MNATLRNTLLASALVAVGACTAKKEAPATTDSAAAINTTATPPAGTATPAATPAAPTAATAGGLLDPNSATKEQLVAVPGMTPAAADALIAGRPYADMLAVDKALSSLDANARKTVYVQVFKPVDINKATKAEIVLIPGVGNKMEHEFEEYRPWTSTAQFDREIGKYVDKTEVERLKKYVSIK